MKFNNETITAIIVDNAYALRLALAKYHTARRNEDRARMDCEREKAQRHYDFLCEIAGSMDQTRRRETVQSWTATIKSVTRAEHKNPRSCSFYEAIKREIENFNPMDGLTWQQIKIANKAHGNAMRQLEKARSIMENFKQYQ